MSLSSATLSAIQQAGAAVFAADTVLKDAVREYAERVHAALADNPYNLGNDTLFENWKVVARLAQTMGGIEAELKKVFQVAADLCTDDQPSVVLVPALAAPAADAVVDIQNDMAPTDVVAKTRKPSLRRQRRATRVVASAPAGTRQEPSGNAAKLLAHLEQVLNSSEFTPVHQSATAQAIAIPIGSMAAAIKKLIEIGRVTAGPGGRLRLN